MGDRRVSPIIPVLLLTRLWRYIIDPKQTAHKNTESTYPMLWKLHKRRHVLACRGGQHNFLRVVGLQRRLLQFRPAVVCLLITKTATIWWQNKQCVRVSFVYFKPSELSQNHVANPVSPMQRNAGSTTGNVLV